MNAEEILSKIKELPPMPQMAVKMINILEEPDFSFAELISLISKDVNITASVLKLANSALFAVKNEITNLTQAMTFLGVKNIKNLVISLSTKALFDGGKVKMLDQKLWEHSVATAIYARIIALKVNPKVAEEAFLLGLLHTIGQVILSKNIESYDELVATAYNDETDLLLLEKETYGFSNAELGSLTMQKWNMPDMYADVIRSIPNPSESSHTSLSYVVALAAILVTEKNICVTSFVNEEAKLLAISDLGLNPDMLEELDSVFEEIYGNEKELFQL